MEPRIAPNMEAFARTPSPGLDGNETVPGSSLDAATSRIMSLLSQSKLKQELECQVRYFLSWKLLSFPGDRGTLGGHGHPISSTSVDSAVGGNAALHKCKGVLKSTSNSPGIRKSLAFKATVSIVVGWLRAHDLVHAAGVLCPEAAMSDTEIMSQEDCVDILRLPPNLLENLSLPALACEYRCSLLDQLVAFAAKPAGSARAPSSADAVWRREREPRVSSAGTRSNRSSGVNGYVCRRVADIRASSDGSHPSVRGSTKCLSKRTSFQATIRPRRKVRRVAAYHQSADTAKASEDEETRTNRTGVDEEAKTQLQLLAARLKRLELRDSSEKLCRSGCEVQHVINQRLTDIETKHEARIRRLQKAVTHRAQTRDAEEENCRLAAQSAMEGAQRRLQLFLRQQAEAEAALAKRERELADREARLADRQERLLSETLLQQTQDTSLKRDAHSELLAQENASLRSQLLAASRQVELLEGQLQRRRVGIERGLQPQMSDGQKASGNSAGCMNQCSCRSSLAQQVQEVPAGAVASALEQEYEGRVARLTQELQMQTEKIKNRDAEFKLLIAELESARQKGAQAQKRAKRLHKLYSAAKTARAQQRQLASSVSFTLNSLDLMVDPSAAIISPDFVDNDGTAVHLKDHEDASIDLGWENEEKQKIWDKQTCDVLRVSQASPTTLCRSSREDYGLLRHRHHVLETLATANEKTDQHLQSYQSLPKSHTGITDRQKQEKRHELGRSVPASHTHFTGPGALQLPLPTKCNYRGGQLELGPDSIQEGSGTPPCRMLPEQAGEERGGPTKFIEDLALAGAECSANSAGAVKPLAVVNPTNSCGSNAVAVLAASLHCTADGTGEPCANGVALVEPTVSSTPTNGEIRQDRSNGDIQNCSTQANSAEMLPLTEHTYSIQCHAHQSSASQVSSVSARRSPLNPSSRGGKGHPQEHPASATAAGTAGLIPAAQIPHNSETTDGFPEEFTSLHHPTNVSANVMRGRNAAAGGGAGSDKNTDASPQNIRANDVSRSLNRASPSASTTPLDQQHTAAISEDPISSPLGGKKCPLLTVPASNGHVGKSVEPSSASQRAAYSLHCLSRPVGKEALIRNGSEHVSPSAASGSDEQASGGPHPNSPWAEASIASSLPESPKRLSNFPSASCPVAPAFDGLVASGSPAVEAHWFCISQPRECAVSSESAPSFSPSDNDWLACVSPSPKSPTQKATERK